MSWYDPRTWFTGGIDLAAESERGRALDAKLAELNADAYARGLWTEDQYLLAEANRQASTGDLDYGTQVLDAFKEGAAEGLKAEVDFAAGTVKRSLNAPWQFLWQAFPWWVWLALVGVGVWYLGGFTYLRGIFAKK